MPLHADSILLLELAREQRTPPIETLSAEVARRIYNSRADDLTAKPVVGEVYERNAPGPGNDIPIRVYRPVDADDSTPCLLFFHGGGWVIGTVDTHDVVCRALTEASHATVVSVEYRLAPEHPFPAAIDDCEAVTRWVAEHGKEIGVDGTRIAVCGDSAGGNLAAAVSLSCVDGPTIACQALIYPAVDLSTDTRASVTRNGVGFLLEKAGMRWFVDHYAPNADDRLDARCSPLFGDIAGQPPTMILTAEYDPLIDDGVAYAQALAAVGVDVEYHCYDGLVHTFFTKIGVIDSSQDAVNRIAAFVSKHW